jgi:hypothetical protein
MAIEVDVNTKPSRRGRPSGQLQPEDLQRKYRGQRKFSVKEIRQALQRNFGNCYMAANALNEAERERGGKRTIDRRSIAYHVKRRPELRDLAEEGREEIADVAEQTVFRAIRDGNISLSMRYLEVQSRSRGYSRREDVAAMLMRTDFTKLTTEQLLEFRAKLTTEQAIELCDLGTMSDEVLNGLIMRQQLAAI